MIATDTSVLIPFLNGGAFEGAELLKALIADDQVWIAPVTLAELLSDARGGLEADRIFDGSKVLSIDADYWRRTGLLRARMKRAGRRARMPDALIAQACLDHDLPLLTGDRDFMAFAEVAGLRLA